MAMMIALDNQPFGIIEDDGFHGLMAHLQPRYLILTRHFFPRKHFLNCMMVLRKKFLMKLHNHST